VCELSKELTQAIGQTPLVEVRSFTDNPKVRILAKIEGNNVGGSVKDRAAWYMIREAERGGKLAGGKTILEATSGNTGIALAMIAAARGYKVKLVMPACVSMERRAILEGYGAELVLSPACEATDGAIRLAHKIIEEEPDSYYMPNQFANEANVLAHYETTGPEIWEQTGGELTAFVSGLGTSGTIMGAGRFLKEQSEAVQIIAAEPLPGHRIQGLKNMQEAIIPAIYDPTKIDLHLPIEDDEAFNMARALALKEGLFVGMSSGAAMAAAVKVANGLEEGTVVTILPDRGDRYLSTNLFRSSCGSCPP
jgi:cysteine synthase B